MAKNKSQTPAKEEVIKEEVVSNEETTLDPGITEEAVKTTLDNLDSTEEKLNDLKKEIAEFSVQSLDEEETSKHELQPAWDGKEVVKVYPTFDPKIHTSWTNEYLLPPTGMYFNYDHFRWNLGRTEVLHNGYPRYRPNGYTLHLRMQLKFIEMIDCLHPSSSLKRDKDVIMRGSRAFADILHMAFNAGEVDPEHYEQPNIYNCFQLIFEWMNDPDLGKVFNRQYIYAYVDRALPKLDWFWANCMQAVERGNEPSEWRANSKELIHSWNHLRSQWPRNHLPKFDMFVKYWVVSN